MRCLHPHCPMGGGLSDWGSVLDLPELRIRRRDKIALRGALAACGPLAGRVTFDPALTSTAAFHRLAIACPCLYAQIAVKVTARAVVHLCEVTLGRRVTSSNVCDAFDIQHPAKGPPFAHPPVVPGAAGGDIMEALCSEVLENDGVPHMRCGLDDWPAWESRSHVSLNRGKFHPLKLYGDILIPCAPHNLLISVKSEAARERFVVSGNRLESVGFGFFSDPAEFWSKNRMTLLRRWGFVAVYMPASTLAAVTSRLGTLDGPVNINGRPLYRDLAHFGSDMCRVAGKLSSDL